MSKVTAVIDSDTIKILQEGKLVKRYSNDTIFAESEIIARRNKKGLWKNPNPMATLGITVFLTLHNNY